MKHDLISSFREIKLFLFDLEGVLINEFTRDKIELLIIELNLFVDEISKYGAKVGIVTASDENGYIKFLSEIEGLNILARSLNKVESVDEFIKDSAISYDSIFYIGDDVLDIPLLQKVKFKAAPVSAKRNVKRVVDLTFDVFDISKLFEELRCYFINSYENYNQK
ncbi:MAG: HAD hydrolase family protein [Ignavibacteriaceae bacterium]|jgi:3-deoxy-D-manno-octulosonate 8-phosphate phosphatase KdsC-like HAD superfamily phosphatase|nr:HAD hydrolase family protein [Ignavibacteriaceae bacterium]